MVVNSLREIVEKLLRHKQGDTQGCTCSGSRQGSFLFSHLNSLSTFEYNVRKHHDFIYSHCKDKKRYLFFACGSVLSFLWVPLFLLTLFKFTLTQNIYSTSRLREKKKYVEDERLQKPFFWWDLENILLFGCDFTILLPNFQQLILPVN